MRVACPHCNKPTRSYLGSGWAVTWCNKCDTWFRTANEMVAPGLIKDYQISKPTEKEKEADD